MADYTSLRYRRHPRPAALLTRIIASKPRQLYARCKFIAARLQMLKIIYHAAKSHFPTASKLYHLDLLGAQMRKRHIDRNLRKPAKTQQFRLPVGRRRRPKRNNRIVFYRQIRLDDARPIDPAHATKSRALRARAKRRIRVKIFRPQHRVLLTTTLARHLLAKRQRRRSPRAHAQQIGMRHARPQSIRLLDRLGEPFV